jgi:2-dehydro-3-deoxyphosphogluconate aldolase/(4S)-4-hydroxy-2-oxoglutarate aldolase
MTMDRDEARALLLGHRMIAVLRTPSAASALAAGRAVLAGGARLVEVTTTVPGAIEVLRELKAEVPANTAVGMGTVLSPADVERALAAGADFLISPDLNPAVVAAAQSNGAFHVPGVLTPSEITAALRAGAEVVKLFPVASVGGAAHLAAIRGPLPSVKFLAAGGVDLDNLGDFLAAGAAAVGLAATLVVPAWVAAGEFDRIRDLTRAYVARLTSSA